MNKKLSSVSVISTVFLLLTLFCICPEPAPASLLKADKVVVIKRDRLLMLLRNGEILKTYKVALGRNPIGQKMRQGDKKTPEGTYYLDRRTAHSRFHRALHISYPNEADIRKARALGVSPGSDVMIHGLPNGYGDLGEVHRTIDWTKGCIALTNEEIDEIWRLVPDGTPIEIKP
jgi:murein L,D-transpeptidase YafK